MNAYRTISTDVLIIGAGAAGIRTAIELKLNQVDCLVIGKRMHGDAHTVKAAGGINASLGSLDPEDTWEIHAADTIREGHFINDSKAVEIVCKAAPEAVIELEKWGCNFNKTPDGKINQRYFGAQSFRRTCFVGDVTGRAILETLVSKAKSLEIPYQQNTQIVKLFKANDKIGGALGFCSKDEEFIFYRAKAVVLAAGGFSAVYNRHSSRKNENTGDGVALAFDAGVPLQDMEFVQFHPTGMIKPEEFIGTLVSEATRGEGGRLFNVKGERFMEKYSPEKMELDARDVVARAIANEIYEGRGTSEGGVYLDISHEEPKKIKSRLPDVYERFMGLGIDITREPMEIAPTAHYTMGGVATDFENGKTNLQGLYAVGEVTAGMHGANRLGGNSLLETVVLGRNCGAYLAKNLKSEFENVDSEVIVGEIQRIDSVIQSKRSESPGDLIKEMRDVMWKSAGIIRNAALLKEGVRQIMDVKERSLKIGLENNIKGLEDYFNLCFMIVASEAAIKSALKREESRGAHYRSDFSDLRNEFRCNIICQKYESGEMKFSRQDIRPLSTEIKETLAKNFSLDYHHLE